jgi:hypothetical protein
MNSAAPRLFDSLATEQDLERLVTEGREEDLYLEFKQKAGPKHGSLDPDDRKNFSQSLSAFANADGGVLVFGIKTVKVDGVDRAHSLAPLASYEQFRSRLMDSILHSTQPLVDDVRIESIPSLSTTGSGFVKVLVPQSFRPPHRAMLAGREYWRRTSSGTRRLEHFELEDVFGRRLRPVLVLVVRFNESRQVSGQPLQQLQFNLLNVGRGVARHAGFHCRLEAARILSVAQTLENRTSSTEPAVGGYARDSVIHPNGIVAIMGQAMIVHEAPGTKLRLRVRWYAEEAETKDAEIEIGPNETVTEHGRLADLGG